jgi:hypothetical protein
MDALSPAGTGETHEYGLRAGHPPESRAYARAHPSTCTGAGSVTQPFHEDRARTRPDSGACTHTRAVASTIAHAVDQLRDQSIRLRRRDQS